MAAVTSVMLMTSVAPLHLFNEGKLALCAIVSSFSLFVASTVLLCFSCIIDALLQNCVTFLSRNPIDMFISSVMLGELSIQLRGIFVVFAAIAHSWAKLSTLNEQVLSPPLLWTMTSKMTSLWWI